MSTWTNAHVTRPHNAPMKATSAEQRDEPFDDDPDPHGLRPSAAESMRRDGAHVDPL